MNEVQYEKLLNIHTSGFQYGFPKEVRYHRYEPTPYEGLDQLFEQYQLPENAYCVDIGCGKGRVSIYLNYKFQIPTVGIEMDKKFYVEAVHNAESYLKKHRKKQNIITFHCLKGETYKIADEENVFFFFNPFSIDIFRQVYSNIMDSFEINPRKIHLILYYPAPEYLTFIRNETIFEQLIEVKLLNEKNINERIIVFEIPFI